MKHKTKCHQLDTSLKTEDPNEIRLSLLLMDPMIKKQIKLLNKTIDRKYKYRNAHSSFNFIIISNFRIYGAWKVTCRKKKKRPINQWPRFCCLPPQFINSTYIFLNCFLNLTNHAHGLINHTHGFLICALRFVNYLQFLQSLPTNSSHPCFCNLFPQSSRCGKNMNAMH